MGAEMEIDEKAFERDRQKYHAEWSDRSCPSHRTRTMLIGRVDAMAGLPVSWSGNLVAKTKGWRSISCKRHTPQPPIPSHLNQALHVTQCRRRLVPCYKTS